MWKILMLICTAAFACTGMQVRTKDGRNVNGRTVEFGITLPMQVAVVPRGISFQGTTPLGPGISYKSKYAAVGCFVFGISALMDGINEKGLCVGAFYFPGFAEYTKTTQENLSRSLSPIEFPHWILTQFGKVDEVRAALSRICIAPLVNSDWGSSPPPFHYVVYDKEGKCLVIEPLGEKLVAYDNPLGVITNSPTFDWHMTNLRNYINMSSMAAAPLELQGVTFDSFGMGSGMLGLPGDFTPPSRFVRAALFSSYATKAQSTRDAVLQLFHLLNQFDIPFGSSGVLEEGAIHYDYTMTTSVKDPQSLQYFFRTYDDQSIRMVDLRKFNWKAGAIQTWDITGSTSINDISELLH